MISSFVARLAWVVCISVSFFMISAIPDASVPSAGSAATAGVPLKCSSGADGFRAGRGLCDNGNPTVVRNSMVVFRRSTQNRKFNFNPCRALTSS